jgi:DNA-binding response OmpR family regulator
MHPTFRILVVDDEPSIRYFVEETLTDEGYQVVCVDSGEAALACIETQTFDLALIDLRLPGVSGIDVLTSLRRHSPDTTIIVLTAHASLDTAVEALRQGAHDYLFKPCEPDQLRASVRSGLVKRQRELRQQKVLARLEQTLNDNLTDILATAFERVITPSLIPESAEEQKQFPQQSRLAIDCARHMVTLDSHPLELSPTEFSVLAHLLEQAPRVVPHQELARKVMAYESEPWEVRDIVRSHIYRIRRKAKAIAGDTDIIRTVRGIGYTISDEYAQLT